MTGKALECVSSEFSLAYGPIDDAEIEESICRVSDQWAEALARLEYL